MSARLGPPTIPPRPPVEEHEATCRAEIVLEGDEGWQMQVRDLKRLIQKLDWQLHEEAQRQLIEAGPSRPDLSALR